MENTLVAAYSADDKYAHYLGIAMKSLVDSQSEFDSIHVIVMDCGISDDNKQRLESIANDAGSEITFVDMRNQLKNLNLNLGDREWFVAAYARLFLADIVPEKYDRVLYCDCDTIVKGSLKGLWDIEFKDELIAGVQDTVDKYFLKVIGLQAGVKYINTGVLLVNLKAWREENIKEEFKEIIKRFNGNVPHHDQGIINCASQSRRVIVPIKYNLTSNNYSFDAETVRKIYFLDEYYSQEEVDDAIANPVIVHYTTGLLGRPWEEGSAHPEREAFWQTVKKTPWKEMKMLPDSRKASLKAFTFVFEHIPKGLFIFLYRRASFLLHLKK